MNQVPHELTRYSPAELWDGSSTWWEDVRRRMQQRRELDNKRYERRLKHHLYSVGQWVLVYDYEGRKRLDDKFRPFWLGPWQLKSKLSTRLWVAEDQRKRRRIVHSDSIQPFVT